MKPKVNRVMTLRALYDRAFTRETEYIFTKDSKSAVIMIMRGEKCPQERKRTLH